jgi:hypothetical protein
MWGRNLVETYAASVTSFQPHLKLYDIDEEIACIKRTGTLFSNGIQFEFNCKIYKTKTIQKGKLCCASPILRSETLNYAKRGSITSYTPWLGHGYHHPIAQILQLL